MSKRKPNGYWQVKENVAAEALKYSTRSEFIKSAIGAYASAVKNGWLDDTTSHMISPQKPKGYWNKENVAAEALKYNNITDFREGSSGAYTTAHKNNWISEVTAHMTSPKNPKGYWNDKDLVAAEALKYNLVSKFKKGSGSAYNSARANGWLEDVTSHMISPQKPKKYWQVKANTAAEALKYNTRNEFYRGSGGAYNSAVKNGWLDEVCSHMKIQGSRYARCIYIIIDHPDYKGKKEVYVGLTYDMEKRNHRRRPVRRLKKRGIYKQVTDYLPIEEAIAKEKELIAFYQNDPDYKCLNKRKGGGLGGGIKFPANF